MPISDGLIGLLEFARRKVAAEHSERPIYLVFPAFLISSKARIDSSSGVATHNKVSNLNHFLYDCTERTRINAVQIVEVGGKTESVNSALDIFFYVRCRVG